MKNFIETRFDEQFLKTGLLKWLPWVGKNYSESESVRLLVVGESNYKWEEDEDGDSEEDVIGYLNDLNFNKDVIRKFLIGEIKKAPIYHHLTNLLFYSDDYPSEHKEKLWQLLSYYNFIQSRYMTSINDRPNSNDWESGWQAFFKVVDILRPNYILFCGVSASKEEYFFKKAANENSFEIKDEITLAEPIGNTQPRIAVIKKGNDYEVQLTFIKHPSAFFPEDAWMDFLHTRSPKFFQDLCELCGEGKDVSN